MVDLSICASYEWYMALLSQLVSVMAFVTGDPEPGLIVLARSLREAGYITTGGRGRSAAHMKERDAAALLLAATAPGDNTRAADTLGVVGNLRLVDRPIANLGLRPGLTMLDGLTLLFEQYANGEQDQACPPEPGAHHGRPLEISLIIRHDRLGWSGDINAYLSSGEDVYFRFTPDGQELSPHPERPSSTAPNSKQATIRQGAIAAHLAINCVRGVDRPFSRRPEARFL